jgi:hypothetical protein
MKIQEQFINNENGTTYWKIHFEVVNKNQLSISKYELINNLINSIILHETETIQ